MTAEERKNFILYLRACSNAQLQGVYDKEKAARRGEEVQLTLEEANRRGVVLA